MDRQTSQTSPGDLPPPGNNNNTAEPSPAHNASLALPRSPATAIGNGPPPSFTAALNPSATGTPTARGTSNITLTSIQSTITFIYASRFVTNEDIDAIAERLREIFRTAPPGTFPQAVRDELEAAVEERRREPGVPGTGLQVMNASTAWPRTTTNSDGRHHHRRNAIADSEARARDLELAREQAEAAELRHQQHMRSEHFRAHVEAERYQRLWTTDYEIQMREEDEEDAAEMREMERWMRFTLTESGQEILWEQCGVRTGPDGVVLVRYARDG
ncbi:hypothetical protein B0A55_08462 [Friedmanniomyces simplex]|uniref:Uncharacterized protein n=1 Tax=Friedmanniomyces simplex TaxID=329884 RepID=A0A4U0X043_9PEZI|nr:hypothetical protein B0A55_08462 [Friedmanniomyces simplex]